MRAYRRLEGKNESETILLWSNNPLTRNYESPDANRTTNIFVLIYVSRCLLWKGGKFKRIHHVQIKRENENTINTYMATFLIHQENIPKHTVHYARCGK